MRQNLLTLAALRNRHVFSCRLCAKPTIMIIDPTIREKTNPFEVVSPKNVKELFSKASRAFGEDSSRYSSREKDDPSLSYNSAVPASIARTASAEYKEPAEEE